MAHGYILKGGTISRVPTPIFPIDLDSNYTLFHVYNSTQSVLAENLTEDATKIAIIPKSIIEDEVWPNNGFVSLPDELIYYDDTEKDQNGKVCKLLKCIRALEGEAKFNEKGTPIYGNIVAQHHNQLVQAIIQLEETIGDLNEAMNFPENLNRMSLMGDYQTLSLQASLSNMAACPPISDDACPDVEFIANVLSTGPTVIEYCVRIFGSYLTYRLDFGDGNYTTTEFSGTYTYSGGTVNPTVTVTSSNCCIVQQPVTTQESTIVPTSPNPSVPFVVTIPEVPDFPSFITPKMICPGPLYELPPLIIPPLTCTSSSTSTTDLCSVLVSIIGPELPSTISIVGCCPPSTISIVGCDNLPSFISVIGFSSSISIVNTLPSTISLVGCCDIPSVITFVGCSNFPSTISLVGCCDIPNTISITCCDIPSIITFANAPTFSAISFVDPPVFDPITFDTPPTVTVDWGIPPCLSCCCSITIVCPSTTSSGMSFAARGFVPYEDDYEDITLAAEFPINENDLGIPKEIKLIVPKINNIKLLHDIPSIIELKGLNIPDTIRVVQENPIPEEIKLVGKVPETIFVDASSVPDRIKIDASDMPVSLKVEPSENFPTTLEVNMPTHLQVVGIPPVIEVKMPSTIELVAPDDLEVPLVYKGAPIDLNVNIDITKELSQILFSK